MNTAHILHGAWGGPYRTDMADGIAIDSTCRLNPYVTGYGAKIPTRYRILYCGRWRRVYLASYGNSGSTYVVIKGVDTIVEVYIGASE
mgnify:FL=1